MLKNLALFGLGYLGMGWWKQQQQQASAAPPSITASGSAASLTSGGATVVPVAANLPTIGTGVSVPASSVTATPVSGFVGKLSGFGKYNNPVGNPGYRWGLRGVTKASSLDMGFGAYVNQALFAGRGRRKR